MNDIRITSGGSTGRAWHAGPGVFTKGYGTVANGRCSDVSAGPGEVTAVLSHGDANCFTRWITGTPSAVVSALRERGRHELAAEIEAARLPMEPLPQLAHALGIAPAKLATALEIAGLKLAVACDGAGLRA